MKRILGFGLIVGFWTALHAQTINVRGRVANGAGQPVANAVVELARQGVKDTTGSGGEYSIVKSIVSSRTLPRTLPESIRLENGILEFAVEKPSPFKVEVFDVNGNLRKKELLLKAQPGVYHLNIAPASLSNQMLIVQASIGPLVRTFRYLPSQKGNSEGNSSIASPKSAGGILAKLAAAVDTLNISAAGYAPEKISLFSYDTTVNVTLEPDTSGAVTGGTVGWWKPVAGMTWDWQLETPIDHGNQAEVYDIDMFNNPASEVSALHAKGRKVICYIDFGSWEAWRPDADQFPPSVLGATYEGFPDERWLDIRRIDLLAPILRARLDLARTKGCDAIEPDNIDGYDTTAHEFSGFPLTYDDQLRFNRWIAAEAHARGMAVGIKNDINQAADLVGDFDFAVSEECFQYGECHYFSVFIAANKPVFEAEYEWELSRFCSQAIQLNFSAIRKRNALDAYRESCR